MDSTREIHSNKLIYKNAANNATSNTLFSSAEYKLTNTLKPANTAQSKCFQTLLPYESMTKEDLVKQAKQNLIERSLKTRQPSAAVRPRA